MIRYGARLFEAPKNFRFTDLTCPHAGLTCLKRQVQNASELKPGHQKGATSAGDTREGVSE